MEIVNEDFGQRHEAFKESSRANNFSDKFFFLEAQKILATFWYNKILQVANTSLRVGGLDPVTLNIGSDVALSFYLPNYQNTGHQHNGDHSGTL